MTPTSGANVANPTHHVVLTDPNGTSLGLMICDPRGSNDPTQIRRAPYPRTGLKITQGATKYADKELPFADAHQEDWSGGRAALNLSDDLTRFYDSYRAQTEYAGMVTNGAQETYGNGGTAVGADDFPVINEFWPGSVEGYVELGGNSVQGVNYLAVQFTATDSYTAQYIHCILSKAGSPGSLTVYIYSDTAGSPNASLGTCAVIPITAIPSGLTKEVMLQITSVALTTATPYWLVFYSPTVGGVPGTDYWKIHCDDGSSGNTIKYKVGTGSWLVESACPFYRIVELRAFTNAKFFEYNGATYCIRSRNPNVDVNMYINGDRGVATGGAVGTLIDSTKTWGTTQWVGATVKIIRGTGSDQPKPYRTIASHDNTTLTLTSDWDIAPGTTTEYVICDTDIWNLVTGAVFTTCKEAYDVAVAGDFVYIATDVCVWRYSCYNVGGTFTQNIDAEAAYATHLLSTYDSANHCYYLWGTRTEDSFYGISSLWKMRVPPLWGDLYNKKADLLTFDQPWDDLVISNVTVAKSTTVDNAITLAPAAGFATGLLAAKYLTTPLDITEGTRLNFAIKSSVAVDHAGDLKLILSDDEIVPNTGLTPAYINRCHNPSGLFHETATATFTDMVNARDALTTTVHALTWTNAQYIYVIAAKPFGTIRFDMGTTVNDQASEMTASYMSSDSALWESVTITDGTRDAGLTKTLAQDGNIVFTQPYDWQTYTVNNVTGYCIRLAINNNLKASLDVQEVRVWASDTVAIDLPALTADTWTWVSLTMTPLTRPYPDDSTIKSIGLHLNEDFGAQTITLKGAIEIAEPVPEYIHVQTSTKIKRLIQYGEERGNPWLICEDGVYEVQTENSDLVVKLPLDELKQLADPTNGMGAATNDVYLYWNMGERLERYYSGKLEDLGPDRDEGLPSGRSGIIRSMISYPGAIYAAVSGCYYPSVLTRKSSGWHEVYRGPMCFKYVSTTLTQIPYEIYDIFCQSIPGQNNRLWIAQKDEILSLPIQKNKMDDYNQYTFQSVVVTPWIDFGFLDVSKRFIGLKIYSEDLDSIEEAQTIAVDYQLETGSLEGTWTRLSYASNLLDSTQFITSPFERKLFSNVSARRIRLRFILNTLENDTRPILRAWILEAVLSLDVSNSFVLPVRLSDHATDLQNNADETARIETLQAQIDTWAAAPPTVLTMTSIYSPADNKSVVIQPMPLRPYKIQTGTVQENSESWIAEVTLLEVA